MIGYLAKRVNWLLERVSGYEVSKMTGIPRSSVYAFKKGIGKISNVYYKGVRDAYRRTSYAALRKSGFSASQSARYRGYEPLSRLAVTDIFKNTVHELSRGAAISRLEFLGLEVNEANIKRYLPAMAKKVRAGLHDARTPFEDWVDYARV